MHRLIIILLLMMSCAATAGTVVQPGDLALRHDIQRLADYGVISGTVMTWPLAWGPILEDLRDFRSDEPIPTEIVSAIDRLRQRGEWESKTGELRFRAGASLADNPGRIRSFQDTPREQNEVSAGFGWTGDHFSIELNGQALHNPSDGEEYRADGSQISVALGNWAISASTLDRWWGPGWDGSLILSSNARSIPALSFDRIFTDPFETRWLKWIGPWDLSVHFGQLESDRVVSRARLFAFRFAFRPLRSLEIGLSRTAQWCGGDRICDAGAFWDLLLGKDNIGENAPDRSKEPGNQLAGLDLRWSLDLYGHPVALYGQFTGEDEAGGFPSRYLGQFGVEGSGLLRDRWSYRWFAEASVTSCDFWKSDEIFNCAYNHGIYQTGYRYRGRAIGHGADNDARIATIGVILVDIDGRLWSGHVRGGKLNRSGFPDLRQSITPTPQNIWSVDLSHRRTFRYGTIEVGLGYENIEDAVSATTSGEGRFFASWRSAY